jgi:hypothetical protein
MRIPIDLAPDKVARFLDCLEVELGYTWEFGRFPDLAPDGAVVQSTNAQIILATGNTVSLLWTITIEPDNFLRHVDVSTVDGEPDGEWSSHARQLVINALSAALNDDHEEVFLRRQFAYVGPPLDGEYYLPRFRLAPATLQPIDLPFSERILFIDQTVRAITGQAATSIGAIQARRYASLLSLLLDVGLYEIHPEHRWVLVTDTDGTISSQCLRLGFKDSVPPPKKMPPKGRECNPGAYRPVSRKWPILLDIASLGPTLQCPADTRPLVKAANDLETAERAAFFGAAALFQIAAIQRNRFPSSSMAYEVAAIDASKRSAPPTCRE